MTRRPGMTLVEIQVAIFVVAIGLLGVIAMFPYGAKQMSDALTADRTTTHAAAMDGLVRSEWRTKVVEQNGGNEPYWIALDEPNRELTPGDGIPKSGVTFPAPAPTEPSYPVFLDPMGVLRGNKTSQHWVGEPGSLTNVPRRTMNLVANSSNPTQTALRMWSQADGFGFDEDGRPTVDYDVNGKPTTSAAMRELRYNALAVIQRPVNRDRYRATLKIVVFGGRRHLFYPPGVESTFGVNFTPGSTKLQLPTSADIKKGSWIMDATVGVDTTPGAYNLRHANFYRVVSATENTAGVYDIELNTPVTRVDGGTGAYAGTVVVPAGVLDVFERPALSGGTNP